MSNELLKTLETNLKQQDFESFKENLLELELDHTIIRELDKIIQKVPRYQALNLAKELFEAEDERQIVTGGLMLQNMEFYRKEPEYLSRKILEYSNAESWNVRQVIIDLFVQLISNDIDDWKEFLNKTTRSDNIYHRRIALQAANAIAKSAKYDLELKKELLGYIEYLISDDDPQVLTISSEVLGEGFLRNCPELTLDWIKETLKEVKDPFAKSTLINVGASRHARAHIGEVLEIIDMVLKEDDPQIKKARSAVLHNLSASNQQKVNSFLESRLEIKQAVDHWAELEADGSINFF